MPQEDWPKGMERFDMFVRLRDGDARYRAICWNPVDRKLHVLKLVAQGSPQGPGEWSVWSADAPDAPLKDIRRLDTEGIPDYMKLPLDLFPPEYRSALKGFARRKVILEAFCMLDVGGRGDPDDYVFNDLVVTEPRARKAALNFVILATGYHRAYAAQIQKLFHQHCHFGGHENSMLAQHAEKGKSGRRPNLVNKPGALTHAERQDKLRSIATGKARRLKRPSVSDHEKETKFLDALRRYWVKQRWSLAKTYRQMLIDHYSDIPEELHPTYDTFQRIANDELIPKYHLREERDGVDVHDAHSAIHSGSATDYTQGKFETVDVDGWVPKVRLRALVNGKWKKLYAKVLFAVSRNSRAVLGIEIVLTGEDSTAYRRCIASCFMDKSELAKRLGLERPEGLLHGNINFVFFDNGSGPTGANAQIICKKMRLGAAIAPPARGRAKACVESFNNFMINALLDLPGAYTRANSPLSKDQRRNSLLKNGTSLGLFIRSVYETVAAYNLDASRPQLLSHQNFMAGKGSSPKELFEFQQGQRRGDARKKWSERELLTRFIDWEPRTVVNGRVLFETVRYSSPRLEAWAEGQIRNGDPLDVDVKRFTSDPLYLVWKPRSSDEVAGLKIIRDDLDKVQNTTWQELKLVGYATQALAKPGEKKPKQSGRLKVEQHNGVRDAVRHRTATGEIHDIAGATMTDARQIAILENNRKWDEREAAALGLEKRPVTPAPAPPTAPETPAEAEYDAWLKAKKAARDERRRGVDEP